MSWSLVRRRGAEQSARLKRNVPPLRAARNCILFPFASLSTQDNCAPRTRFVPRSSTRAQECVDASYASPCARLSPYCTLLIVKYDISCGRQSSKASVFECVLGGYAPPDPVGDSR